MFKKWAIWDFSGGPVVKNLPASVRDVGSIPGPGRAHMPWGNASPWAITTEACLPQSPCSPKRKATPRQSLRTRGFSVSLLLEAEGSLCIWSDGTGNAIRMANLETSSLPAGLVVALRRSALGFWWFQRNYFWKPQWLDLLLWIKLEPPGFCSSLVAGYIHLSPNLSPNPLFSAVLAQGIMFCFSTVIKIGRVDTTN